MSEKFGEKLRGMRVAKRRTLEELAAAVGSSKAYIWQLENKKNAKPSADLLLKIAKYFGEPPEFFLDDSIVEPAENHVEDAFFRKYRNLSDSDKRAIERIVSKLYDEKS